MSQPSATARATRPAPSQCGPFKFLSMGRTHVGCVRRLNEDAFLERPDIGLWAVSDGMGGHNCGEVASGMVVQDLARIEPQSSAYGFRSAVGAVLQTVNQRLLELAASQYSGPVGATIVALLAHQEHYAAMWAGDSRCYLYRDGLLQRLTRDHSALQEMLDAGAADADKTPANVITRAVGAEQNLELDCVHGRIKAGDRFLLCSDGLTGMIDDREIRELMARPPLESALDRLMERALARGAPDNVTLIIVGAEPARP